MKFSEYIIEWHENRKPLIRASTFESESEYTYRQIAPFFADTELEDLKPLDIQKYVNAKLTSGRLDGKPGGLSTVSVQKHLYIIKQSLNDAVLYGYLTVNPALPVRTPRRKTTQTRRCVFLEAEQAAKVVNALSNDHAIQTAVLVTLLYGLRRSEILGLSRAVMRPLNYSPKPELLYFGRERRQQRITNSFSDLLLFEF